MKNDRRHFMKQSAAAMATLAMGLPSLANAHRGNGEHHPIGIQLYTLGNAVQQDPAKTFALLADFGYREIEALTYPNLTPTALHRAALNAGLLLRSAHLDFATQADPAPALDIAGQLGIAQVVSSILPPTPQDLGSFLSKTGFMTVSDFQRMADRANRIGEAAQRAGFSYAYHNHNFEFRTLANGVSGYDVLLRETDPRYVKFELDCAWISYAGANAVSYLKRHAHRFSALHIKNIDMIAYSTTLDAAAQEHITELSRGVIDYRPILEVALRHDIAYLFIEHDPRDGVPIPMDMVEREFDYLDGLLATVKTHAG